MYELEPGQYAKKYSFWAREYVAREEQYISIQEIARPFESSSLASWAAYKNNVDAECTITEFFSKVITGEVECSNTEKHAITQAVELDHVCFDVCGFLGGEKPTSACEIIKTLYNNEDLTTKFNTQFRGFTPFSTWEGVEKFYIEAPDSPMREFDGKKVVTLNIEYDKPIKLILDKVRDVVACAREAGDNNMLFQKLYRECDSLEDYDRCASLRCAYKPSSDKVRAIGLWLFDYVHDIGNFRGSIKKAITEIGKTSYLSDLSLDVEDADLRFYLRRTTACIEAREVLSFAKKGTQKKKLVPGTEI